MRQALFVLVSAVMIVACTQERERGGKAPAVPAGEPAGTEAYTGLPAWEEEWEKPRGGKADEFDDYREAHPEWYGVTAPPVVAVRPYAEYEPTQAVMLRPGTTISKFHQEILKGLWGHVPKITVFHSTGEAEGMKEQVSALGLPPELTEFVDVEKTDATWTRDYGPLSAVTAGGGQVALIDFRYYHQRMYDDAIPTKLAGAWGINVFRPSMSYEGGNFMADTQGTCYATEKIYKQNAGHTKDEINEWMLQYVGCKQLVTVKWPEGLGTGHIDMFCKLMDETTALLGEYDPGVQPVNAKLLDDNGDILGAVTTEGGKKLAIIRLPLPWDETGVWYTYTNSLIVNDTVLIPVYGKFKDQEAEALAAYAQARPDLEQYAINADAIIPAGGAIHCVTQTVPEGKLEPFQDPPVLLCDLNEINKCEGGTACGGLSSEGNCDGTTLQYCGSDGYPHAQSCDACCGFEPEGLGGSGWYNCLPADQCLECIEECKEGEKGCSVKGTHAWICVPLDDDSCLEREYAACAPGMACDPATAKCVEGTQIDPCQGLAYEGKCVEDVVWWCGEGGVSSQECAVPNCCGWNADKGYYGCISTCDKCADECKDGEGGCSQEGTHEWGCKLDAASGCRKRVYETCFPAKCEGGKCQETCGAVTAEGVCEGDLLKWCDAGTLLKDDCAAKGKKCGPVPSLGGDLGCWEGCLNGCEVEGARVCTDDGLGVRVCEADQWTCLDFSEPDACPPGTTCFDGVCSAAPEEEPDVVTQDVSGGDAAAEEETGGGGDGCCSAGPRPAGANGLGGLALIALLAVGLGGRRRWQVCAG